MTRFILAAGVAALAIAAPATAERGGHGGGKSHVAKAERGGGSHADRGGRKSDARVARAERHGGSNVRIARAERRMERARVARADRFEGRRFAAFDRHGDKHARSEARIERRNHDERRALARLRDRDEARVLRARELDRDRDRDFRRFADRNDDRFDRRIAARYNGFDCPPGLYKKSPRCIPPGQVNKLVGQRLPSIYARSLMPDRLRNLYRDNDDYYYRYGDGYAYRVDRKTQLVNALLPLFGAGLGLGQVLPMSYSNAYVPSYYSSFYPDSRDNYYRYANGYVYGVDRDTGLIEQMIPLMAGGYGVGQMLPAGYSAYNVPYEYRDTYYDTDDYYYRYAPGAIYQVDPQTQLITGLASLLSPNGFTVGQRLPIGYSAYNVPYGYRDQYYDTADNWYRYNNGNIYQVDPTTQLITAIIRAVV